MVESRCVWKFRRRVRFLVWVRFWLCVNLKPLEVQKLGWNDRWDLALWSLELS